ncbi:MAG: GC-type dockerin domain-anchored protein [Phycisphaerales bacterium]|nr:hypothetical protein [Phycisphaeraceae bacterium]
MNSMRALIGIGAGVITGAAGLASAAEFAGVATPPRVDRWMYPFNENPASRTTAGTFTTLGSGFTGFDDRDAQWLVGFATDGSAGLAVPMGYAPEQYRLSSVTVRARLRVADPVQRVALDTTIDAPGSYLAEGDPGYVADADAGRPVEMFACAYRGNAPMSQGGQAWSLANYAQASSFATVAAVVPPARGNRAVYPTDFVGGLRDVSNNVTEGLFAPTPMSVGRVPGVSDGTLLEDDTTMVFDLNLNATGVREYVQRSISSGRLNVLVTSLHPASAFGAGEVTYPIFATRFFGSRAPELEVVGTICVADVANTDGDPLPDGVVDNGDFNAFFSAFFAAEGDPARLVADVGNTDGELGRDGVVDNGDFQLFFAQFFAGCP